MNNEYLTFKERQERLYQKIINRLFCKKCQAQILEVNHHSLLKIAEIEQILAKHKCAKNKKTCS